MEEFPGQRGHVSVDEAEGLIRNITHNSKIDWDWLPDGCWDRAHYMAYVASESGIKSQKAWMVSSTRLKKGPQKLCPPLVGPRGHPITWDLHVAPVIQVSMGDEMPAWRVIDPATSLSLQRLEDWHCSMNDRGAEIWLSPAWVYKLNTVGRLKAGNMDFSDSYSDDHLTETMVELARLREAGAAVRRYRDGG